MTFDTAIVQFKPHKGTLPRISQTARYLRAVSSRPAPLPHLIVLPEAALTGTSRSGVQLSFSADALRRSSMRNGARRRHDGDRYRVRSMRIARHVSQQRALCHDRGAPRVVHVHRKMFLPTYGVFDETGSSRAAGISVCFRRRSNRRDPYL